MGGNGSRSRRAQGSGGLIRDFIADVRPVSIQAGLKGIQGGCEDYMFGENIPIIDHPHAKTVLPDSCLCLLLLKLKRHTDKGFLRGFLLLKGHTDKRPSVEASEGESTDKSPAELFQRESDQ